MLFEARDCGGEILVNLSNGEAGVCVWGHGEAFYFRMKMSQVMMEEAVITSLSSFSWVVKFFDVGCCDVS